MFLNPKLFLPLAAAAGAFSALPSASADPFLPVPPASFLNYHVSTARGLSEEVAQDVVVRARLARHFGMSGPAVCDYVRRNLVETTLTASQAGRYRVACISPSGREYYVTERLNAGTPVFALAATGQPILRLACGNPLVAALPAVPTPVVKVQPAVLAMQPKTIVAPVVSAAPAVASSTAAIVTPMAVPQVATASPVVQVGGVTQSLSGGKGGAFVPAIIGAAGVGILTHHHDTPTPETPPTAPVPEANSMALFGLFGIVMLGMQAKKRVKR
jgi:hypothetical protein